MGGGGPAKAADPKVTPFVDYSAQTPDIPNWFANRTANAATFTPDFTASQSSFGQPQQAVQQPMPSVQQNVAPTGYAAHTPHNAMREDWTMPRPPQHIPQGPNEDHLARMERRRMRFGIPTAETRFRPTYQNYTDTDPMQSTGPDGTPLMGPTLWSPGRR